MKRHGPMDYEEARYDPELKPKLFHVTNIVAEKSPVEEEEYWLTGKGMEPSDTEGDGQVKAFHYQQCTIRLHRETDMLAQECQFYAINDQGRVCEVEGVTIMVLFSQFPHCAFIGEDDKILYAINYAYSGNLLCHSVQRESLKGKVIQTDFYDIAVAKFIELSKEVANQGKH